MRGARNYPCMGHPGKRAPTVELCDDPKGYLPTGDAATHARAVTSSTRIWSRKGVPPDDRVDFNDRIYAPIEGTPLPPGAVPGGNATDRTGSHWHRSAAACTVGPPAPPGNSLNGVPIPPVEAPLAPAAAEVPPAPQGPPPGPVEVPPSDGAVTRGAKCVQRQGFWWSVGCDHALRPAHGTLHDPRRAAAAGVRIRLLGRSPDRGRTCCRSDSAPSDGLRHLLQPHRQLDDERLVDAACTARAFVLSQPARRFPDLHVPSDVVGSTPTT